MKGHFLVVYVSLTQHYLDTNLAVVSGVAEGLLEMSAATSFEDCRLQGLSEAPHLVPSGGFCRLETKKGLLAKDLG